MFHTQEKRTPRLTVPIRCVRRDAWLGKGFYFWDDLEDAVQWGRQAKRPKYEIYQAEIDCDNVLDTVFNEDHYRFWVKQIETVTKILEEKTGRKPRVDEVYSYFTSRLSWFQKLSGLMFSDSPTSRPKLYIRPHEPLAYRKRIQLAVYDLSIMQTFTFHSEG